MAREISPAPLLLLVALLVALLAPSLASADLPPRALELRNLGIAQLENEQPAEADRTYQQLARVVPNDPLPWANRAIAALRQQQLVPAQGFVQRALALAPDDPRLLALQADILQWSGRSEQALPLYRRAARRAPDDLEILYALYRHATILQGEEAQAAADFALARLAALRPENLVVLLQRGQRAIGAGDRAGATGAFLRVRELLWQAAPIATTAMEQLMSALEEGELERARIGAVRVENVLKVTPMFQQGLSELTIGVQGVPLKRFLDEPSPASFGDPVEVTWRRHDLATPSARAVLAEDLNGDGKPDLAVITGGEHPRLELRLAARGWQVAATAPAPGLDRLRAADLGNEGRWELVGTGPGGARVWHVTADGSLESATAGLGLEPAQGRAAVAFDFDIDGDLDLVLAGDGGQRPQLWRNPGGGPFEEVAAHSFPAVRPGATHDLVASDLDRDGDLDLLIAHEGGLLLLDNLRQGRFADVTAERGLAGAPAVRRVVAADLTNDGFPDLVAAAGDRLVVWRNRGGRFALWRLELPLPGPATALAAIDVDNDGRLDLVAAGDFGVALFTQRPGARFERTLVEGAPGGVLSLAVADLDGDGDLDLVLAGDGGLTWLENRGGNRNGWLAVSLRGLTRGNSKNNHFGLGSTLEVRAGAAYQLREATGGTTHFGLGSLRQADTLRVTWTNGVPQHRVQLRGNQQIVEEQVLKGSCPFLYVWDGEEIRFVTDLLWNAPLGLPLAPGVWASADPTELVKVAGAAPRADGRYDLRVTEELWEAAYFDFVSLWVVDHPEEVEVASNLKVVPGQVSEPEVVASRGLRPVAAAWDGAGRDVTGRVAHRDEIYADGYVPSPYQGVATEPWAFTFDLGEAPAAPVRLHLDGWIFPADASLNLAVSQREDLEMVLPRLEVEVDGRWEVLVPDMGFPAGKTKTMVVDTPQLPPGAHRLRVVTSQWLSWDRIVWTTTPADQAPVVQARLGPETAELRYRGFSRLLRQAPNAPHVFDYQEVTVESPWLPLPGRYTRYGEVRELLAAPDDRLVILGPGDELALTFDASELSPPPPGWRRTVFLESHGWDKDADRNTWMGHQVDPLPFRAMSGYPWGEDEHYPDTPELRRWQEEWLTRVVE